jgi:hypothetical protein
MQDAEDKVTKKLKFILKMQIFKNLPSCHIQLKYCCPDILAQKRGDLNFNDFLQKKSVFEKNDSYHLKNENLLF